MEAKEVKKLARELKSWAKSLNQYHDQLMARHKSEPLKSPPVFLLNSTALAMEFKATELLDSVKK